MLNDDQFLSYQEKTNQIIETISRLLLINTRFTEQQGESEYAYLLGGKEKKPYSKDNIITGSYSIKVTSPDNASIAYSIYFSKAEDSLSSVDITKVSADNSSSSFVNTDLESAEGVKVLGEIKTILHKLLDMERGALARTSD